MTVCNTEVIEFSRCKRREVQAQFSGGAITSDAGVLLLREVDRRLRLTERVAKVIKDPRCKSKVRHQVVDMVRQRVYGLALGYEDLVDHDTLRSDPAIQTAVDRDQELASSPTLSRFENWADPSMLRQISSILVESFIESHPQPPKQLILDFDATDDPVHGESARRLLSRLLRPLLLFAIVRVLRRKASGGLSSSRQCGWRSPQLGDFIVVGQAPAAGLATGSHYLQGRQRFLPPADAFLVRSPPGRLYRRDCQKQPTGPRQRAAAIDGRDPAMRAPARSSACSVIFATRPEAGKTGAGLSSRPSTRPWGPTRAMWLPVSAAIPSSSTMNSTARAGKRKIVSKNSSFTCAGVVFESIQTSQQHL